MLDKIYLILKFKVFVYLLMVRKRVFECLFTGPARQKLHPMINIGGGLFFRPHWQVMDFVSDFYPFSGKFIDFDVDLMTENPFPFEDNSVGIFYSSHTLEHIPEEFCQHIINEMHRCLKPGGVMRLTMPDYDMLRHAVDTGDEVYLASHAGKGLTKEQVAVSQIATAMLDEESADEIRDKYNAMDPIEFADHYTARASRDVQKKNGGFHINWFNYDKLSGQARNAGFQKIERSHPQGSQVPQLRGKGGLFALGNFLDGERRLGIDTSHPQKSLFLEAVK